LAAPSSSITAAFTERNLSKAGYSKNPLDDDSLAKYQVLKFDITKLTADAVKPHGLSSREAHLCRNMWALGLLLWMYGYERTASVEWLKKKYAKKPLIAAANEAALNAGHAFGETAEMTEHLVGYVVPKADVEPGRYRTVSGTEGLAWGLVAGLRAAGIQKLVFAGYPITPASALLHILANLRSYGVVTFQAEDEIAAAGAALGASYAGALGVTSSSGPGIALKTEMLGLAIATELPLIVIDSQRAGPSTGMPTKAEQSDLFQAVLGRNADAPLAVLAPASTADCFSIAMEAVRIATKYMTPVMVLSDGYLAHAAEPWRIPREADLPSFPISYRTDPEGFHPFLRDPKTLARPWVKPGTPQLEHRIGGLERDYDSGHISYDPDNHARMTKARADKIAGIANDIPLQTVALGNDRGKLALVGWGSTFGGIHRAVQIARNEGRDVSHIHVRYLSPFPRNLGDLLRRYDRVIVPEMNNGQLVKLLRAEYLVPAESLPKVTGKAVSRYRDRSGDQEDRMTVTTITDAQLAPKGLRLGPGSPLVSGLRRLRDPEGGPEGLRRHGARARAHRVRERNRMRGRAFLTICRHTDSTPCTGAPPAIATGIKLANPTSTSG
jgi:2-oxoglutarate ferredoxin oxidoreductase subunit alpha